MPMPLAKSIMEGKADFAVTQPDISVPRAAHLVAGTEAG
jgi:hypothetical protein